MAWFRSSPSRVNSFLLNKARNRVITSEARLPSRRVRRKVSRAPSRFGGSPFNILRHVLVLVMMPERGWLISWATEAVNAFSVVTRATWASSERALVQRLLGDLALCYILKSADEQGVTPELRHHTGHSADVLHCASRKRNPEYKIDIRTRHAARYHGVERRQVLGMDNIQDHLTFGTPVEGSNSKMRKASSDQSCSSASKSVMKLPVLLSCWASARRR